MKILEKYLFKKKKNTEKADTRKKVGGKNWHKTESTRLTKIRILRNIIDR